MYSVMITEKVTDDHTQSVSVTEEAMLIDTVSDETEPGFQVIGVDSTAAGALIECVDRDDDCSDYSDIELHRRANEALSDDYELDLITIPRLINDLNKDNNFRRSVARGRYARRFILIGKILIKVKEKVRKQGLKWKPWAEANIQMMDERCRQQAMQLAKASYTAQYAYLGKERLLKLHRASKEMTGDDPIVSFLQKYRITFDPEEDKESDEYINEVDMALEHARFQKSLDKLDAGLEVSFDVFRNAVRSGLKADSKLVHELLVAHSSGNQLDEYLTAAASGAGQYEVVAESNRKVKTLKEDVKKLKALTRWMFENRNNLELDLDDQCLYDLEDIQAKLKIILTPTPELAETA